MTRFLKMLAFSLVFCGVVTAQTYTNILENGTNLTVDSVWNTTDLVVGGQSASNGLNIFEGARVTNAHTTVGGSTNGNFNSVNVRGDAQWDMTGDLMVGDEGSDNYFEISSGATVDSAEGFVGLDAASSNNTLNVTGSGSAWNVDGGIYIAGISNTVAVDNGGQIEAGFLDISTNGSGFFLNGAGTLIVTDDFDVDALGNRFNWADSSALAVQGELTLNSGLMGTGRTLSLSGSNASWAITGDLVSGTNGQVYIESGAVVTNTSGGISGENNDVIVQGGGAHLLNQGALTATGIDNEIYVQSGGKITADSLNLTDSNELSLNEGGTLALTGDFNWLASSNLNWNKNGNLEIQGTLTGMETVTQAYNGNTNAVATILDGGRDVTLSGGSWSNVSNDRIIGYEDSDSNLRVTNGALVVNQDGYIGWGSDSANNSVLVSGADSVWQNAGGDLYLGAYWNNGTNLTRTGGSANYLYVTDGAQVFVGEATNDVAGMLVASTNGANFTVWNGQAFIDDTLTIGLSSNVYGTVSIANGGDLSVGDLVITNGSKLVLEENSIFRIGSDFDQQAWAGNGFVWDATNSTLQVGGELTRTNYYLDKGQNLILSGSNAVWDITGQDFEIGRDGASAFTLADGASFINGNTMIGAAANTNQGSHGVFMREGATWTSSGDLDLGTTSSNNFLVMRSGSQADIAGTVHLGGNSTGNEMFLAGSNTLLEVGGSLMVGNGTTNSFDHNVEVNGLARLEVTSNIVINAGNWITLSDGATNALGGNYTVSRNASVFGTGTVEFDSAFSSLILEDGNAAISTNIIFEGNDSGVEVTGGEFYVFGSNSNQFRSFQSLEMTDAALIGYGTNDAFSMVHMTNVVIEPNRLEGDEFSAATLVIDGAFTTGSNVTYKAQLLGSSGSDMLKFTGTVDLTNMAADVYIANATEATNTILTADGGLSNSFNSTNIVNGLLLWDANLLKVGDDIQVVLTNNTDKFSSSLDYAGTEAIRAGFGGMKNAVFTRTKQLRRNLVSTAHSIPHEAFLMTNTNSPTGPQGPGEDNTIFDMHIWAQYFTGQGEYDAHGNSYGYSLNNGGTTFGADKLIGEALVVGFNYTYARADATTTNEDFLDSETYWLGVYGEWVNSSGWFVDGLAAYGRSNYDSERVESQGDIDYRGVSSYRGDTFGAYMDVGQYMYYKNLSIAPYAGLHMLFIGTDDHTESNVSNDSGSQIKVHGIDRNIVESALGLKGRYRFDTAIGRFQATGYAEWTHDFVQDEVASTLQADAVSGLRATPVAMAAIKPEDDLFNVGLGLSWRNTEYMEIGIGYNSRFSEDYEEHTGSLMLDIMF